MILVRLLRSKILVPCLCLVLVSFLIQTAEAATGLNVTIDTPVKEKRVSPGGTAIFPLTVKNTGTVNWTKLTLTRSEPPAGWKAEFHFVLVTLPHIHYYVNKIVIGPDTYPPGTTMPPDVVSILELQVTAPETAEPHDKAVITATATVEDGSGSLSSSQATAAVTVTTYVPEFPFGLALHIFFIPVIIYIWWKRKHKIPPNDFSS